MFGYKGLSRKPINANVISYGQARVQTDSSSCSSTAKETEEKSRTLASKVNNLDRYSIQVITIFKPPAGATHFPPKLSQRNVYSAYSE